MDTNGDGIVDENESQNQPVLTGNNLTTEEIQMDTNGDGIVDENESQNQPVLTGNNLPHRNLRRVLKLSAEEHLKLKVAKVI